MTPRGQLRRKLTRSNERTYERVKRYRASNPEIVRKWRDAYNARRRKPPVEVKCATELCEAKVYRYGRKGALKFCEECVRVFYGPAYARRRAA